MNTVCSFSIPRQKYNVKEADMPHIQKQFHPRVITLHDGYLQNLRRPLLAPQNHWYEQQAAVHISGLLTLASRQITDGDTEAGRHSRDEALRVLQSYRQAPSYNLSFIVQYACEILGPEEKDYLLRYSNAPPRKRGKRKRNRRRK